MNHKRRKPKNARAGCLMCKPHKMNGASGEVCLCGFAGWRKQYAADKELDALKNRREKW